ncbi:unnamed protein product [Urochloa decumbens]|uniref:Amino acid transporter transmembrane domain-containing protein n=1 Tax=Urochloa decumbens TaxID=240449 RepID=A0ABC9DNX2_9POAL
MPPEQGMSGGAMDIDMQTHDGHGELDDDGKEKRTGTVWTAAAHIITAVIGSGVLSLAWAMAQLGWVAGPVILLLFAAITYYTCCLLSDCYRVGDPATGKRNYTYTEAVESYLGGWYVFFCGFCQYANMFGTGIGYTITASASAAAILKSNCFHWHGHEADCSQNTSTYIVAFGVVQVIFSQLPNFHELWWLSVIAAVMSFSYATIAVGLALGQTISGPTGKTTLYGAQVGVDVVDSTQKIWLTFQALGNIAFAYSYTIILIEIQDTLRSPPAENKTMRQASILGVATTTAFYMMCGCLGYAAFGNSAPGNILAGFYEPYWLVDFANVCIVLHLVGGFQVFLQPLFAAVEAGVADQWPCAAAPGGGGGVNSVFRLVWRTLFVALITLGAVVLPFFNSILGILGSVAFWPLTVFFPVEMYIRQREIPRFSGTWMALETLSFFCFLITIAAGAASVQGVRESLKDYVPFQTRS